VRVDDGGEVGIFVDIYSRISHVQDGPQASALDVAGGTDQGTHVRSPSSRQYKDGGTEGSAMIHRSGTGSSSSLSRGSQGTIFRSYILGICPVRHRGWPGISAGSG
jgi:hypothetical protein